MRMFSRRDIVKAMAVLPLVGGVAIPEIPEIPQVGRFFPRMRFSGGSPAFHKCVETLFGSMLLEGEVDMQHSEKDWISGKVIGLRSCGWMRSPNMERLMLVAAFANKSGRVHHLNVDWLFQNGCTNVAFFLHAPGEGKPIVQYTRNEWEQIRRLDTPTPRLPMFGQEPTT